MKKTKNSSRARGNKAGPIPPVGVRDFLYVACGPACDPAFWYFTPIGVYPLCKVFKVRLTRSCQAAGGKARQQIYPTIAALFEYLLGKTEVLWHKREVSTKNPDMPPWKDSTLSSGKLITSYDTCFSLQSTQTFLSVILLKFFEPDQMR